MPGIATLFGFMETNSEVIGAFADLTNILTNIVTFVMLLAGGLLGYLGYRSLQSLNAGGETRQAGEVAQGGRGAAVGGDVNQSVVVAGDNNQVSFQVTGRVAYDYSDVAPSSPDPGELERARRRLEELPLGEVPDRAALLPGSVMPLRPNRHFVGREKQLKRIAANLKAGDATTISEVTVAASTGLGGVGKTQLASEFVHRYGRYFHSVYWLSFAEPGGVPAEIASCGGTRGMNLRGGARRRTRHLSSPSSCRTPYGGLEQPHRRGCDALRRCHDLVSGSNPPTGTHVAAYRIELAGLGDYTPQRLSETRALAGARWYPAGRAAGGHPGR
jgi:hypothetical protein